MSQRPELFYKSRLANYNITVYNLATKEGICFLSHEGQTRRGANEIASNLSVPWFYENYDEFIYHNH